MSSRPSNLHGILAMVAATGSFVINDAFMKLVTEHVPPFQTLFMRGVVASLASLVLILLFGQSGSMALALRPRVLARGFAEVGGVLCYVVALANMPIADVIAIGLTAPLLLLVAAATLFGERIGTVRLALVALGFAGALLVAQPHVTGLSVFAVLAFTTAAMVATRDLIGRGVPTAIPGFVVTLATTTLVMLGAGLMSLTFETWTPPSAGDWLESLFAGIFVAFAQVLIFLSYRHGATAVVAPFYYSFIIWGVLAQILVWQSLPDRSGIAGMILVSACGIALILMDRRRSGTIPAG